MATERGKTAMDIHIALEANGFPHEGGLVVYDMLVLLTV